VKGVALWSVKKNLRLRKNLKRHHVKSHVSHLRSLKRHRQKPKKVRFIWGGGWMGNLGPSPPCLILYFVVSSAVQKDRFKDYLKSSAELLCKIPKTTNSSQRGAMHFGGTVFSPHLHI
jgi:hypothetical protein